MRLRHAVDLAGGTAAVARLIGMPAGTLHRYRRGREMQIGAAIDIARATGVSLEWLLTGIEPMRPGEAQRGLGEGAGSYRSTPLPTDALDEANLAWALDFVEKTVASEEAPRRVPLMLSAATEFRRVQRMPALPLFQQPVLAAALDAAEQLLRAAGQPLDAGRRVGLMLAIYHLVTTQPAPD